jgi:hypothetical protein
MATSWAWCPLARHGLGEFMLLIAVFLLAGNASARALFADSAAARALHARADGQTGAPDYTCSASKPCALGCCGKNGICGMGPDYCSAANCINSCNAKSECDPGGWGSQYAANTKCPLNVRPHLGIV